MILSVEIELLLLRNQGVSDDILNNCPLSQYFVIHNMPESSSVSFFNWQD